MTSSYRCRQLGPDDIDPLQALRHVFGAAFEDPDTYGASPPSERYLGGLLSSPTFIALVAQTGDEIVGGITAYELVKFEQERKEIYIYDLAVAQAHRRKGIATALIRHLQSIAANRGAYAIFVQADIEDAPAIALYRSLGSEITALHFDFEVPEVSG